MAYRLFFGYMILLSAVFPVLYVILSQEILTDYYFLIDLATQEAYFFGHIYTLIAVVLLCLAGWQFRPMRLATWQIAKHDNFYEMYKKSLFWTASIGLAISTVLSLVYGMSPSNLTAQRPMAAVYAGYLSRILIASAPVYVGYQLMLLGRLSRTGWLIVLFLLAEMAAAWSRSGLVSLLFLFLFAIGYGIRDPFIHWRNILLLVLIGLGGVLLGQFMRSGDPFSVFELMFLRFYANNAALYLAMTDHERVFNILTEGQPFVMFDQIFSFARERTLMPSSFRLLEFWGANVEADERGHIAGYAYGWLGLTYGILGWWGLMAIYLVFVSIFKLLNYFRCHPSLLNTLLFFYVGGILFEFFGNLGLDSFVEKIFKGFLSVLAVVVVLKILVLLGLTDKRDGCRVKSNV